MDAPFRSRLDDGPPVVLDGGLATTLEDHGHDLSTPLWSAALLRDEPEAVVAVHRAFAQAGAEVLTTASYQLSALSLAAAGLDPAEEGTLIARSVAVAREAAARTSGPTPWVAASIGAYGASLADGSEYRGRYGRTAAELADFHRPRIRAAVEAGADVLACETIPSGTEVEAVARVLADVTALAWVSVTVAGDGSRTPEGQPVDEALWPATATANVVAVGVNCCTPEQATVALDGLAAFDRPLVVYPNLGRRWAGTGWVPDDAAIDPAPWLAAGARLVGGCCGTAPTAIAELARVLAEARAEPRTGDPSPASRGPLVERRNDA